MKIRKTHASWAVRLWVLASVFVVPFIGPWELAGWLALGGLLGLAWKSLPEEPETPPPPLPFAEQYRGRQVPTREE